MEFEELTNRIAFKEKKNQKDDYGELEEVLESVGLCWSGIRRATVKEFANNEGRANTITFIVRKKQRFKIDSSQIIFFEGNNYEIIEMPPTSQSDEFKLIKARSTEW
ncbi:phage head closure protein [Listeria monocytogenes]|uniref:phage head closure protein n=1 Tax=Listeria TaxID=1637 RepID=UPI00043199F7|nr:MULTISPECIES: phage head closure protein [Listeria]EAA0100620.1 head-tail adaptor protein [Listeria monocytogenes]EAC4160602.1 head-tail adaptor protein [Listeria monocytogenes]EAC5700569.1 head-tail adaptor protein [Listeria monocytogenes]EAC6044085.1 head-tail adaptor protein [Listeria monocytogenes]EAC6053087.1 head-tail adaptor protein [Listeria monocytogenes]